MDSHKHYKPLRCPECLNVLGVKWGLNRGQKYAYAGCVSAMCEITESGAEPEPNLFPSGSTTI